VADARPDLHDRLVQLRLDLPQDQRLVAQDLGDVERSSRVSGSMIWYSSSIPMVSDGGFMQWAPWSAMVIDS
jgi:hypothetical protein